MPFKPRHLYRKPWLWERKKNKKAAMRTFHYRLHPATNELMREVQAMYGLYYKREFDVNSTLRHALQNANLNVRKCLRDKKIDPEPAIAEHKEALARRAHRGALNTTHQDSEGYAFEGPAPDAARIDIG